MRLNAIMAVVTVSCVVAVVAGPRIGPLNIRGHHVTRGGAASNNHWREIGMEYLDDDDSAPVVLTLASALGGTGGRLLTKFSSQHDDAGPGDPINPLNGLGHALTGQSRFALATGNTAPSKPAPAEPPAPPPTPSPPAPASPSGGIQPFVAPTDPPAPPPGPPEPGPPDPQGPPVIEPPVQPPPTPVVVVTLVTTPTESRPPPAAPLPAPALPEPATWALMLLGFAAMGAALRRRRGIQTHEGARAA